MQTCLKTFFRVYKKTLTHVRLTINFIPSDKNIYSLFYVCLYECLKSHLQVQFLLFWFYHFLFCFPFGLHYCFQYSTALYPSSIPIFLLFGNSSRIILFLLFCLYWLFLIYFLYRPISSFLSHIVWSRGEVYSFYILSICYIH